MKWLVAKDKVYWLSLLLFTFTENNLYCRELAVMFMGQSENNSLISETWLLCLVLERRLFPRAYPRYGKATFRYSAT